MSLEAIRAEIAEVRGVIAELVGKLQTVDGWLARLAELLGE
jgi:hypothetical protein